MSKKDQINFNFSKAATNYGNHAKIQNIVAKKLIDFSAKYINDNDIILDIGSGTGFVQNHLDKIKKTNFFNCDISLEMLQNQNSKSLNKINCDFENLAFDQNIFDLVISSFSLQWALDYDKVIKEVNYVLKKDAFFILALPLAGSLSEIKQHISTINDFIYLDDLVKILQKNNFKLVKYHQDKIYESCDSIIGALRNIKKIGANQTLSNKNTKNNLYNLKHINKFEFSWNLGYFIFQKQTNFI